MNISEIMGYLSTLFIETFGLFVAFVAAAVFLFLVLRKLHSKSLALILALVFIGISLFFYVPRGVPHAFEYPFFMTTFGPAEGPALPLKNVLAFFKNINSFERVSDIARDPMDVPPLFPRDENGIVHIDVEAKEVMAEMTPGVVLNYWTFGGTVPGPFMRVREGDTVELTLHNHPSSIHHHSIDLHAVTGPGGGAAATVVAPGESKTFRFKALNPGLYVYHCAHPNVANHMAHGMYGLILVEPKDGLPAVDKEFYVMQGEFYTVGSLGKKGLQVMDGEAMLRGEPSYVVFNGKVKGLVGNLTAQVGEKVRLYVGNGGVNLISSFHMIGEIFNRVYPEAAMGSDPHENVQTTLVPAGGATIAEVRFEVPGTYVLVDHALARIDRGAWGTVVVGGPENKEIFDGIVMPGHGH